MVDNDDKMKERKGRRTYWGEDEGEVGKERRKYWKEKEVKERLR